MLSRCSFVSEPLKLVESWSIESGVSGLMANVPSETPRKSRRQRDRSLKNPPLLVRMRPPRFSKRRQRKGPAAEWQGTYHKWGSGALEFQLSARHQLV